MLWVIFKPIDWWWLAPFALVPFAYILFAKDKFSLSQSMIAGSIISLFFSIGMSFPALTQFHWYALAEILTIMMQLLWIPIALLAIFLGSFASWLGRKFQDGSLWDVVLFASVWTGIEIIRRSIFMYFDYGLLGYSVHALPFAMEFAGIGGVLLISFLIASINGFIARIIYNRGIKYYELKTACGLLVFLYLIFLMNHIYLYGGDDNFQTVSISMIQINERKNPFGKFDPEKNFILSERTQNIIKAAALQNPDYLIYPFNIVGGILTDGSDVEAPPDLISGTFNDFGGWLATFLPQNTRFVMWTNTARSGSGITAEINFWTGRSISAFYNKRTLFPFIDFTPISVQKLGVYTTPVDYIPGERDQIADIGGIKIGNLICSELNLSSLASYDAAGADIIFAIGSSAIFRDNIMGDRNLILAQFRAAENNIPIIRSDRKGPSAVIGSSGEVLSSMQFEKEGVLRYDMPIRKNHRRTLYGITGDWLIGGMLFLAFLYQILGKRRLTRFL